MNKNLSSLLQRAELQKKLQVFLGCLVEAIALVAVCMSGLCKTKKLGLNKSTAKFAVSIALVKSVADMYSPALGRALRQGAGFGVGAMMVGFP